MMNTYFQDMPAGVEYASEKYTDPTREGRSMQKDGDQLLRKLVWAYFVLLIFEGALRKWFLPGLATPLLIVRDPVALLIVLMTWQRGMFPITPYLFGIVIIGIIGIFTATLLGHGNLWVALYGARIFLLHYPMMFAIGRIFTRNDVVKMGKAIIFISIPLAVLVFLQFYSPQSAWVNRGLGGLEEGSGFTGAMGYFRPSATFSFTNGTTLFFGLVAPFVIYFWLHPQNINRIILIAATVGLLVAVPLSISRALFFGVGVSVVFAFLALSRKPSFFGRMIPAMLGMVILISVLYEMDFFQKGIEVFSTRFESANETEGGLEGVLMDRYLGGMIGALSQAQEFPFFGYGLGLGTNVGSMLVKGEVVYLISEGEWGRLIGELGAFMGLLVIIIRIGLCLKISMASYVKLVRGDLLPWMLLSYGLIVLPQSQWAQPTTLGFSTLIGGLMLASLRIRTDLSVPAKLKSKEPAKPIIE